MARPCKKTRACISLLPYFLLNSPPLTIETIPIANTATTEISETKMQMDRTVFMLCNLYCIAWFV